MTCDCEGVLPRSREELVLASRGLRNSDSQTYMQMYTMMQHAWMHTSAHTCIVSCSCCQASKGLRSRKRCLRRQVCRRCHRAGSLSLLTLKVEQQAGCRARYSCRHLNRGSKTCCWVAQATNACARWLCTGSVRYPEGEEDSWDTCWG